VTSASTHVLTTNQARLRESYVQWIKEILGNPTHAVTLTFKSYDKSKRECWNQDIVQQACRVFLGILNTKLFGSAAKRKKRCIGSAFVLGRGRYKNNPHAHFALVAPKGTTTADFEKSIHASAELTRWVKGKGHINPYWSEGWLGYMIDHGSGSLLLSPSSEGK
jgi:hypothetical protein